MSAVCSRISPTGFMLPNEEKILENIVTPYNKFFIPLIWAAALVNRARKEGRIKDDFAVKTLIDVNIYIYIYIYTCIAYHHIYKT